MDMSGRQRLNPAERTEKAQAIRTRLDDAAALINAAHAQILADVITAQAWKVHRDLDGYSSLRDWLAAKFDFHYKTAADLAAIARNSGKFAVLTEAATSEPRGSTRSPTPPAPWTRPPPSASTPAPPTGNRWPPLRP
ncbi:hypothetical protein GCM10029992_22120 [Glycomyces albus]